LPDKTKKHIFLFVTKSTAYNLPVRIR